MDEDSEAEFEPGDTVKLTSPKGTVVEGVVHEFHGELSIHSPLGARYMHVYEDEGFLIEPA